MANSMTDLVVVIPGIMVSTPVDSEGKELWGVKPGILLRSIVRVRRNFQKLRLPAGIGDALAPDGVRPGALIPIPYVFGKLLGADGYGRIVSSLEQRIELRQPRLGVVGNLVAFPYDWRLSSRINAKRIETELFRCWKPGGSLSATRRRSSALSAIRWEASCRAGSPRPRMAGNSLAAHHHRHLHRGAEEELRLANGFDPGFGPLRLQLTESIRSLPSAHQLLPTCNCVETADGPKRISEVPIPDMDTAMLADALTFHERIQESAKTGAPDG